MANYLSLTTHSLLLLLFSLSLSLHSSTSCNSPSPSDQQSPNITEACKASADPPNCIKWLSNSGRVPPRATIPEVIQFALSATNLNLRAGQAMAKAILDESSGNVNRSTAASTCLELLGYAKYRIAQAHDTISSNLKDTRAWVSASLAYQYDCWSALKYVNDTKSVLDAMVFFNGTLIPGTSSTLGMMVNYDIYGENTGPWAQPQTERHNVWEPVKKGSCSDKECRCGVPTGLKVDLTVRRGGSVQKAVDAAPDNLGPGELFVIWIQEGVYDETVRVPLKKKNVVFLGEGVGKTVITGTRKVGDPGVNTYNSATLAVAGDGFMASNITIKNTAGPMAHQAVAFRSDSDRSVMENCEFFGHQDTLYAHTLRQLYKNCTIQGNVDFIFGNSAAVFEKCTILVNPRQVNPTKGETNAVTAHGRTDPAQSTGFVFLHSLVDATAEYKKLIQQNASAHITFLGRPWKQYSRTVYIKCTLKALISPAGWMPWDKTDFALTTLYYGEYKNRGPGYTPDKRVNWSSQIPANHVCPIPNFLNSVDDCFPLRATANYLIRIAAKADVRTGRDGGGKGGDSRRRVLHGRRRVPMGGSERCDGGVWMALGGAVEVSASVCMCV
ncbi:plant invertase/pectin methylesterase inhibitor [Striga asiatica]|uniref:pectinesterase n=1 Tax=Striga asiatica TaxID=4170 RepID=A0A5A7QEB6_STRAF|nr:plant invertase/pectin methylesterase inhibitor [Striga asiatica]